MTTGQIAEQLVAHCRAGRWVEAITDLYAPTVRQHENGQEVPGGRDVLVQACRGWVDGREMHGTEILGLHVADDSFVLELEYDVTPHATKRRHRWREAAVYRVLNGKIADVRFYYKPPEG